MAEKDFVFARKGQVDAGYADNQSDSTPAVSFTPAGCFSGPLQVNDSYGTEAIDVLDNWCYNQNLGAGDIAQLQLGERTIEIAGTLEVDLDDAAYKELYDLYKARTEFQFELKFVNAANSPGSHRLVLLGHLTSFNRTARSGAGGTGTAQWDLAFHANTKVLDTRVKGT